MNTAKCFRENCPHQMDGKCARPLGTCGGSRVTRKPKKDSRPKED
jgi:hypothetical protein